MIAATHHDVVRLFPGLQDHAAVEILAIGATIDELEVLSAVLADDAENLLEKQRREDGRIDRLLSILNQSGIQPQQDRDR